MVKSFIKHPFDMETNRVVFLSYLDIVLEKSCTINLACLKELALQFLVRTMVSKLVWKLATKP